MTDDHQADAVELLTASDSSERRAFADIAAGIGLAVVPCPPPPALRARLLATVRAPRAQPWKSWNDEGSTSADAIVRAADGAFEPTSVPGVSVRRLFVDAAADRVTMLIRMAPGSSYPRHRHGAAEECFVLEGDLRVGEDVMHAGDYQRVARSSVHGVQSTDGGCLLLINSSQHDEILA